MRTPRRLLAAVALAVLSVPLGFGLAAEVADDRSAAWLAEVRDAEERVPHQGRRAVTLPEEDGTQELLLDVDARRPGSPRVSPAGPAPAALPKPVRWMGFLRGAVEGSGGRRPGRFSDPDLIVRNYRLVRAGRGEVAGRPVERARLEPRHPGRATYELAVDRDTRLPLAFRATSAAGRLLYDTRFESVSFPRPEAPSAPKARSFHAIDRTPVAEDDLRGLTTFEAHRPAWLPPGFVRTRLEIWRLRNFGESLLGVYGDGMTSLYVAQVDVTNPGWRLFRAYLGLGDLPGPAEDGALEVHRIRHAGGTILDLALDGTEILVGGQLEASELERVAAGLEPIGN